MTDKFLPLGTIVSLKNGNRKLMITARYPLYNNQGKLGYFDFSACLYPNGNTDNQSYFLGIMKMLKRYISLDSQMKKKLNIKKKR